MQGCENFRLAVAGAVLRSMSANYPELTEEAGSRTMNLSFCCAVCNFRFRVEERFLGRRVCCPDPQCRQPILLDPNAAVDDAKRLKSMVVALGATPVSYTHLTLPTSDLV